MKADAQRLIARLMGGLGNQFFIYAAALSGARRRGARLEQDAVSGFQADHVYRRQYVLDQFAVTAPFTPPQDQFVGWRRRLLWRWMLEREALGVGRGDCAVVDETTAAARWHARRLHFSGYWQSEKYFTEDAAEVRRQFTLRASLPEATRSELAKIQAEPESVAVGIRRFHDRPDPRLGYTTGPDFYEAALSEIARTVPGAHFFVITEEPDWVARNMRFALPHTFVSHKADNRRAFENLTLMQACRHFVLGNSTYHWWGAWLGEKPGSRVLVDPDFSRDNPDFYPNRWQRLAA